MPALSHEVQPTIIDLEVAQGEVSVVLQINLEAFLAGVDLDVIEDTDEASQAEAYDMLRALSGPEIAVRTGGLLGKWNALPLLSIDGAGVSLSTKALEVPDDVAFEFSRVSVWRLTGSVSGGAGSAVFRWPQGGGPMVLRQQGVEAPFTGFLTGGTSSPTISLSGGGG
ncbi:MAG: hypothetical protein AAF943_03030 [Pseudomonadota bacterium]